MLWGISFIKVIGNGLLNYLGFSPYPKENGENRESKLNQILVMFWLFSVWCIWQWYLDGGCSNYMSRKKEMFSSIQKLLNFEVRMGNNNKVHIIGKVVIK